MSDINPEIVPSSGGELVAIGERLMKIENDSMLQAAIQRPRDEAKVYDGALKELEIAPEFAASAFYSIPYKQRLPGGGEKIVQVSGPSIKAAMSLARRWGNCSVRAYILSEDDTGYNLEGIFLDLETDFRVARPFRVSKQIKRRGGRIETLTPDREAMAVQAGASKAVRNAILAGLPAPLVEAYDQKARELVSGKLDQPADKARVAKLLEFFESRHKVGQEQLEKYVEKPVSEWTGNDISNLRGLANAIVDGQTSAEAVFKANGGDLAMPQSVKEAQDAASGEKETGQEEDKPAGRQGDLDDSQDGGREKAPDAQTGRGGGSKRRGKGSAGKADGGDGEGGDLFGGGDPSPEEQEEILKQEKGQYGPP